MGNISKTFQDPVGSMWGTYTKAEEQHIYTFVLLSTSMSFFYFCPLYLSLDLLLWGQDTKGGGQHILKPSKNLLRSLAEAYPKS